MKVCHLTSAHDSKDPRIFYKECTSLAKNGYDVTLVACGNSREENGVHVVGVGKKPTSRLKRMIGFSRKVYNAAVAVDADVYHLHDPELLRYVGKLQRKGKKVIFDSHENTLEQMYEKNWIPKLFRKMVGNWYKHYATKVFKRADALISVTPHIIDMLKKINQRTYMITNYPILSNQQRKYEESAVFTLCFTGVVSADWCHEKILDCLAKIDNCKYILCGEASEIYKNKLIEMPAWDKVEYLGVVSNQQACEVQQKSNVGMALNLPSNNTNGMEGSIGVTKIFEYMMSGIPVICTNFILWKDIIDEESCGIYINPEDVESLTEAILRLKESPDIVLEMGKNGRRAAEKKYNWATQEAILLDIYSNIKR